MLAGLQIADNDADVIVVFDFYHFRFSLKTGFQIVCRRNSQIVLMRIISPLVGGSDRL
jgi:hypothetical protein